MTTEKKKRGRHPKNYEAFLKPGETVDLVDGNVLRKRKHDEKVRQAKEDNLERKSIPDAIDWACSWSTRFPEQSVELKQFIAETISKISDELQLPIDRQDNGDIDQVIDQLCRCSLSLKKNTWIWVRKTAQGYSCAGYIPTYFGDEIPLVHYYNLKRSETFLQLYTQVLRELAVRYSQLQDTSINLIRQELADNYKLPEDYLPWWKIPKPIKVEVKPEVKSYRTSVEEAELPRPPVPQPPQAPIFHPPSLVDYSTRDLDSAASNYLAGRPDPHPERSHLSKKDRRFLYGESL